MRATPVETTTSAAYRLQFELQYLRVWRCLHPSTLPRNLHLWTLMDAWGTAGANS